MSRATQDTVPQTRHTIQDYHPLWFLFPKDSDALCLLDVRPTTPTLPKQDWFGLVPVRSPLLRESLLFSFPPGT